MTYQVFARKWRPKSFSDLVGQEPIKLALSHSLDTARVHHAYLFCGTRGVGKTTLGRLLAKCLNCETGVSSTPCGVCATCTAIDAGCFIDLIEVDAASKTRVEDTRELLDNVQYAPTQGRYKIYLIDEVHMLSTHSFNALLKTLEEPPEHVKFILATTDPEKIPATILSRCLKFVLRPIPEPLIAGQLTKILEQENIAFEKTALPAIATAAQGSMRDALSLLEQAVLVGEGVLGNKEVEQLLGWVAPQIIQAILQAIINQDVISVQAETENLVKIGADFTQVLDRLLEAFYHISLIQHAPELNVGLEFKPLAEKLSLEASQLFYQIGLIGKQELAYAPSQRIGFEMTLLRMLAFYPDDSYITACEENKNNIVTTSTALAPVSAPIAAPIRLKTEMPNATAAAPKPALAPVVAAPVIPHSSASHPPVSHASSSTDWASIIAQLPLVGFTKMLASNCEMTSFTDNQIILTLDKSQQVCLTPERHKSLQEAVSRHFNKHVNIKIVLGSVTQTPMQLDVHQRQVRSEEANKAIQNDPLVQNIVQTFGAEVESITVLEPDKH